jgi:hypothetical protein
MNRVALITLVPIKGIPFTVGSPILPWLVLIRRNTSNGSTSLHFQAHISLRLREARRHQKAAPSVELSLFRHLKPEGCRTGERRGDTLLLAFPAHISVNQLYRGPQPRRCLSNDVS